MLLKVGGTRLFKYSPLLSVDHVCRHRDSVVTSLLTTEFILVTTS